MPQITCFHDDSRCVTLVPLLSNSQSAVKVKSKAQQVSGASKSGSQNGGSTKDKKDVWGPIYQNRQHFIDMHIC